MCKAKPTVSQLVHVVPDELVGGAEALQVPLHEREHLELALPFPGRIRHSQVVAQVAAQVGQPEGVRLGVEQVPLAPAQRMSVVDGSLLPVQAVVVLHAHHYLVIWWERNDALVVACDPAEVVVEKRDLQARALDAAGAAVQQKVLVLARGRLHLDVLLVQVPVLELQLALSHGQRAGNLADDADGLRRLDLHANNKHIGP
ncbi:unnamed protein product [Ixodes hexagonus]